MRNFKLTVCALALGMMASSSFVNAAATDGKGTVEFNGELITETCTIADDSVNIVVDLPTVSTKSLAKATDVAGSKGFDINVISCPTEITKVAAHFEAIGGTGTDSATGNLTNDYSGTGTAATNVQVRLYNSDEAQLKLGETGQEVAVASGAATMRYYGGYYATAATTAGLVHAKAQYTLAYP